MSRSRDVPIRDGLSSLPYASLPGMLLEFDVERLFAFLNPSSPTNPPFVSPQQLGELRFWPSCIGKKQSEI